MKRLISHDEYMKELYRDMSFGEKIKWRWYGLEIFIQDILHEHFGLGEHTTVGKVGTKKRFCMVCKKTVDVED